MGSINEQSWGRMPDGKAVHLYTLTNGGGMTMRVSDYGCVIVSLTAPDRDGKHSDIVLGCDRLADYLTATPYFGCVIGRYGNRIAGGKFTLDGKTHTLATNNAPGDVPCHLYGVRLDQESCQIQDCVSWVRTVQYSDSTGVRPRSRDSWRYGGSRRPAAAARSRTGSEIERHGLEFRKSAM